MKLALFASLLLAASSALGAGPTLNCDIGPAPKIFGGSSWLVYGCSDMHSVVVITAPGSQVTPFYFMFAYSFGSYKLHGEGTGNKAATDAAYKVLSQLKPTEIAALFKDAAAASK